MKNIDKPQLTEVNFLEMDIGTLDKPEPRYPENNISEDIKKDLINLNIIKNEETQGDISRTPKIEYRRTQ